MNFTAVSGHEVHMLMAEESSLSNVPLKAGIKMVYHQPPGDMLQKDDGSFKKRIASGMTPNLKIIFRFVTAPAKACDGILGDEGLFLRLKNMDFDYAIIDGIPYNQCLFVLLYRLDLPYITFAVASSPCQTTNPVLPSFMPFKLSSPRTPKMTFWERLVNTFDMIDWCYNARYGISSFC